MQVTKAVMLELHTGSDMKRQWKC